MKRAKKDHGATSRPVVQPEERRARNPEDGGSNPSRSSVVPPIAHRDIKPDNDRHCADCGKRLGRVYAGNEDESLVFCGACVEVPQHVRERMEMHRQGVTALPPPSLRPQPVSDSSDDDARHDVGSFRRTPSPPDEERPPPARRSTARELWPEYTREVER